MSGVQISSKTLPLASRVTRRQPWRLRSDVSLIPLTSRRHLCFSRVYRDEGRPQERIGISRQSGELRHRSLGCGQTTGIRTGSSRLTISSARKTALNPPATITTLSCHSCPSENNRYQHSLKFKKASTYLAQCPKSMYRFSSRAIRTKGSEVQLVTGNTTPYNSLVTTHQVHCPNLRLP